MNKDPCAREGNENFFVNLQLPRTLPLVSPAYKGHTSTGNTLIEILPERTRFNSWSDFDGMVRTARNDSRILISSLSGTERVELGCGFIVARQQLTQNQIITTKSDTSYIVKTASASVADVYGKLNKRPTIATAGHNERIPSSVFRYGGSPPIDLVFRRSPAFLFSEGMDRNQEQIVLVAGVVKGPSMPLTPAPALENSSVHVAATHNDGYKEEGKSWYVSMMSQALIHAMHTKNGCVFLTNHNQAMFIKVEAHSGRSGWKLEVNVSRLYKCNADESSFHGIIAVLRESDTSSDSSDELQAAFNDFQQTRLRKNPRESSGPNESSRIILQPEKKKTGLGSRVNDATSDRSGTKAANMAACIQNRHKRPKTQDCAFLEQDAAPLYQPELIRRLMEASDDIITTDGHSTVLRSWNGDIEVAVKYWNCASQEGLDMIVNEAEVYEEVADTCPHLLGTVLPRVVALWKEPVTDTVVVTEHVGESLSMETNENGLNEVLRCGNVVLDSRDSELLTHAAHEALKELHETGLRHMDIGARNMRARREIDEEGAVIWRVWFIDLGLAYFSQDDRDKEQDENDLRRACATKFSRSTCDTAAPVDSSESTKKFGVIRMKRQLCERGLHRRRHTSQTDR
ncbi:unnamed protein product [Chondrus crispus]|uniref:Protein kinase domain-containing protein n=1 Tax=Chondrus crispus TaxID=2769 RepID=R7QHQ2_CHOCR|nr:unnamed protein product [Chondrus crispus]CDF36950.1 unnamed protein product [Chondrus crispus]|eukprot:XP_005716769.1 unnamed protein product [Chondrus crispus]